jgi:hypothetical protein
LQGEWIKAYSNVLLSRSSDELNVQITQNIQSNRDDTHYGIMIDTVHYKYTPIADSTCFQGKFQIHSNYSFNSKGELQLSLNEHVLLPDNSIPEDVEAFLMALQRNVPLETFDPNDTIARLLVSDHNIMYMYIHSLHACKVRGSRYPSDDADGATCSQSAEHPPALSVTTATASQP